MRSKAPHLHSALVRRVVAIAVAVLPVIVIAASMGIAQEASVNLRTADQFAVLAGSTITNTGPTTINGDVGLHPGNSVTGFNSVTLNGELHVADAVAEQAKRHLVRAYDDAAGRGPADTIATELGGQRLIPGVYDSASGTFGITGTLTLDGEGDPDSVFVFQMASTLVTATGSNVALLNGADACNVFWQVGSSATLGTDSAFAGNILALTSITLDTGATVDGRTLARDGAVTLDSNTITRATCTGAGPPATESPTVAPTDTGSPTSTATATATSTATATATSTATATGTPTVTPTATSPTTPGGTPTATATSTATSTAIATGPGAPTGSGTPGGRPPVGGVQTGDGSTSGFEHVGLLVAGGALMVGAGVAFGARRRLDRAGSSR